MSTGKKYQVCKGNGGFCNLEEAAVGAPRRIQDIRRLVSWPNIEVNGEEMLGSAELDPI
jgi:hypothetical protein